MATVLPPTRQNLLLLKKRLKLSKKGHKLLKNKHDALIKVLMELIYETIALRREFHDMLEDIKSSYALSAVTIDREYLDVLSTTPTVSLDVTREVKRVMGLKYPLLSINREGELKSYSMVNTNTFLDDTVDGLDKCLEVLCKLIEKENAASVLLEEVETLKRRINALEHTIIPEIKHQIKRVHQKLEELALREKVTILKIKEQMLQKANVESASL